MQAKANHRSNQLAVIEILAVQVQLMDSYRSNTVRDSPWSFRDFHRSDTGKEFSGSHTVKRASQVIYSQNIPTGNMSQARKIFCFSNVK